MRMDMLDNANSLYDSASTRNVRSEVRPTELIELSNVHEQMSSYAQAAPRANYANSYRYSEHITPNGIPMVRWNEPPVIGSNPRQAVYTTMAQTPDLFAPDESVYYTARQTDRCLRELPTSTDIRERRTLEFDSAVEVHEAPQTHSKNNETNTKRSSRSLKRSDSRTKSETNSRANSAQRSSRSSTRAKHKRRTRTSSSRSDERSASRSVSRNRRTRKNRTPSHESNSEESSTNSTSSEDESTLSKSKHMLKPPKFDGQTSFVTFWAQFTNCAEHNKWSKAEKLVYLRSSLDKDVANVLWDYDKDVTDSLSGLTRILESRYGGKSFTDKHRIEL